MADCCSNPCREGSPGEIRGDGVVSKLSSETMADKVEGVEGEKSGGATYLEQTDNVSACFKEKMLIVTHLATSLGGGGGGGETEFLFDVSTLWGCSNNYYCFGYFRRAILVINRSFSTKHLGMLAFF